MGRVKQRPYAFCPSGPADGGSIRLAGRDFTRQPLEAKALCGVVSQHLNLDAELSVRESLDIHGRLFGMDAASRKRESCRLLGIVEMEHKVDALTKTLSGGEKRRIMLARALLHRPQILFLDEPTVGLDPFIRRKIWGLIKRIQQEGTTILLTTHYIEEAEFLADKVIFIDRVYRCRRNATRSYGSNRSVGARRAA